MSVNIEEYLKKYSERTGLPIEEVQKKYDGYLKETNDKIRALKLLRNELSEEYGSMVSKATPFYVYLMGDTGLVDRVQVLKARVERMIREGKEEEARAKGMIDPTGTILDYRPTNRFGKPNPKKGLPLEGSEFERTLLAIASSDPNFEVCRLANIRAFGHRAENLKEIELFKFYRVRGTVGSKKKESPILNIYPVTGARFNPFVTKVTPADLGNKIDYYNIAEEDLADIYKIYKEQKLRTLAIKGEAANISLNPIERREKMYRHFRLNPGGFEIYSENISCYLPVNIPVVFKEGDSLIVFGGLWKTKGGRYLMYLDGYLPLEVK